MNDHARSRRRHNNLATPPIRGPSGGPSPTRSWLAAAGSTCPAHPAINASPMPCALLGSSQTAPAERLLQPVCNDLTAGACACAATACCMWQCGVPIYHLPARPCCMASLTQWVSVGQRLPPTSYIHPPTYLPALPGCCLARPANVTVNAAYTEAFPACAPACGGGAAKSWGFTFSWDGSSGNTQSATATAAAFKTILACAFASYVPSSDQVYTHWVSTNNVYVQVSRRRTAMPCPCRQAAERVASVARD